jgi:hypothetical protein
MRFIKVREGIVVNCDRISSLETKDEMSTTIYMNNGMIYESYFPIYALVDMIKGYDEEDRTKKQEVLNNVNAMAKTSGFFAG